MVQELEHVRLRLFAMVGRSVCDSEPSVCDSELSVFVTVSTQSDSEPSVRQ